MLGFKGLENQSIINGWCLSRSSILSYYSHRSAEKGVISYSLRVIRGCILHDDANI